MITEEIYNNAYENITLYKRYKDGVHSSNKLEPHEGYILSNINENDEQLEDGTIVPKQYYETIIAPLTVDLGCYVAIKKDAIS